MDLIKESLYWLRWGTIKVRSRDPLYLPRRLSYSLRRKLVDRIFPLVFKDNKNIFRSDVPIAPDQSISYFRHRERPRFHFRKEDIDKICSIVAIEKQNLTIQAANEIVKNRFSFRGSGPIVLDPINWQFRPDRASIGWTWDLNRHFFFIRLGLAYWYTKDERYALKFSELSSSWIESNIKKLGSLKWDHPFEVAARINAWIWAYFLFLHTPTWNADSHIKFLSALGRLAEYLYQIIEYHSPGNHILLEAKALALCADLFPEFKRAHRWRNKAWRILKKELDAQICPDGVHAERSTMYHRIVAGELAELMLFCLRNDIKEIDNLNQLVEKMAQFWTWISSMNDYVPLFGDAYAKDTYLRFHAPAIIVAMISNGNILQGNFRS